ncbi:polysaccharide lyase family 7 protein [Actibacterium sp. 188UL27-1]|uniref:polysaccharide lyase family 7 protein n=1 Tax=Actibacterium sp. 188UL27-1 TaxID=2786961 RepID=UPI00195CAAFA|nr:polysaccharide lyase family 7 protein [Actibacterium sp. 188UL27-1]MBM7068555.1 polysaccharide lyase family 7 protein [Actibacterium sp. 188UL27-1]
MAWDFNTFDLRNWKITLPVDADYFAAGGGDGNPFDDKAFEVKGYDKFEGFEAEEFFFYDASQDAMVFRADVNGAKTSANTRYVRSELREMEGENGTINAAWSVNEGGTLSGTLKVDALSTELEEGNGPRDFARAIVGQIHGEDDELVRLYYDSQGDLYYANEHTGGSGGVQDDERYFYFEDENGNRPNVALGETFSYIINVSDNKLTVKIYADGMTYSAADTIDEKTGKTVTATEISDFWDNDSFYFKSGLYQGVNNTDGHPHEGTGVASAAFFGIDVGHGAGEGRDAWLGDASDMDGGNDGGSGDPIIGTADADEIVGTPGADTILGEGGNDDIRGGGGDDRIMGGGGWDQLRGGRGDDDIRGNGGNDLLKGDDGDDILRGGSGSDELWGNSGDDIIYAGQGGDWLKGGNGADTYVFEFLDGVDTIADFSTSNDDQIDISAILANADGLTGSNAFEERYVDLRQRGSDTRVYIDLDGEGSGAAKHALTLSNEAASGLDAGDFILF